MASKAGKVSFGADMVEQDLKKGKVKLLILAGDCSDKTKSKFEKIANQYNVNKIIDWDIETLSKTIGKENKAIIGIRDFNFSNEIQRKYNGGDIIG